ncbi:MAG: hypothetical protein WBD40_24155 [Tepidisphaeraceae bacterium]
MPRLPRRRHPVTRTRDTAVRSMFHNAIEALESRTLFNTIMNDGDGVGVFEYKDGRNNVVRVTFHNVTAELVFARVRASDNQVVLGDATPGFDTVNDGKDLFTIYVAQAGANSFITVAEVPPPTANVRPMQPYSGSVSLTIFGRNGIEGVSTAGGSGSIYLGARTRDTPANIADEDNRPILTDNFSGLGILGPRPNGRLTAGLMIESGQDLGKFFWGGAISGQVTIGGSIDTFYCGALLTGDTRGQSGTGTPVIPNNFLVAGDIRELIVKGSVGTHAGSSNGEPVYVTGFDMEVRGTIGRVQSYGSIIGNIQALNDAAAPRLRGHQQEVETKVRPRNRGSLTHFEGTDNDDVFFPGPGFVGQPRLGDGQADFNNDTFQTPQLLGAYDSKSLGNNVISVDGTLQNIVQIQDNIDHYGVGLLAGQTVEVKLSSTLPGFVSDEDFGLAFLTIIDPDGRVVASDNNNLDPTGTLNQAFQFTADRPGTYRFVVNVTTTLLANIDYNLQLSKVGEMTIGAVAASNDIFNEGFGFLPEDRFSTVHAVRGDVGVVFAGGTMAFETLGQPSGGPGDILVDGGNLRVVDAAQLGFLNDNTISAGPNYAVAGGNIGLIRARTGINSMESCIIKDTKSGVGGDLQLIEAPNATLLMNLDADGALGVARASNMSVINQASVINVNVDKVGADGIIDLIDVSGDLGSLNAGGPQITTGPGGNVRYIHVGGTAFRDIFFGSGAPDIANFAPGESISLVDDSGTVVNYEPIPFDRVIGPGGIPVPVNPGALSVVRYGIRDKGGVVLVRLTTSRGVEITAGGQSSRGTAEIGTIESTGPGTVIVENEGNSLLNPLDDRLELGVGVTDQDLDVLVRGNAVTDIYEITWSGTAVNAGSFTRVINQTGGEIVNMDINSVGELFAGTLGLSKSHTGTRVEGNTILDIPIAPVGPDPDAGPFAQQRIGIQVDGDIVSARALGGVGNFIVSGTIEELIANADGRGVSGVHEGINAPILTQPGGVAEGGGGGIRNVNIGEGILPSGTGEVLLSGLFAHGRIGTVTNQGEGSDIRGDIVSKGQNLPLIIRTLPNGTIDTTVPSPIGTIGLDDGSILGSDIFVAQRFQSARDINPGTIVTPDFGNFTSDPVAEIETVSLNGKGGIMGTVIGASDVGDVVVNGGFGIFNSVIRSVASGQANSIITDGFGLRSMFYIGGGSINAMVARGKGNRLATTDYTSSVRFSEKMKFDPYTGQPLTALNDLHKYLNTTKDAPVRLTGGVSKSGIIADSEAIGNADLGSLQAQEIKNSFFSFASSTNQIQVRGYIDDVIVTTGRLNFMSTGGDIYTSEFNVAGPVGTVNVGGTFRGTSTLRASGPNGQIGTFTTGRSLYGAVISTNNIAQVRVGTDFGAPGALNEDGDTVSAGIDAGGDLNQFIVKGSLLDGSTVFVGDDLGFLQVGGDIQEGATVSVEHLLSQQIDGDVFGDVIIRG